MTKVIGSQPDVPDVGDPIVSPWYQDTAKKIVHTFANAGARDAWVSPPNGAHAHTLDTAADWIRVAGAWVYAGPRAWEGADLVGGQGVAVGSWGNYLVFNFTAPWAGTYYVIVHANYGMTTYCDVSFHAGVDGNWVSGPGATMRISSGDALTLSDSGIIDLAAGAHAVQAVSQTSLGGTSIYARSATVIAVRST